MDMVLLVPYDDSSLSRTALLRARQFGSTREEPVVALVVLPEDVDYVRDRGWIDPNEPFDRDRIKRGLEVAVDRIAPAATVRVESPVGGDERASVTSDIVRTIRQVATELDPEILFIGSENAGRVATPVTSVGSPLSEDHGYDVHIVRQPDPAVTDKSNSP